MPTDAPADRALLYLHGGGLVFRLSAQHLAMVSELALHLGIRALLPEYRLAPRHPWPAASEGCLLAYRWLLCQGSPAHRIVVAGDSAGGNLAIALAMALRDAGDPLPAARACSSPVGDLSSTEERGLAFVDPVLHPQAIRRFDRASLDEHDARQPLISPVYGDWHGLPPLLIHAGEDELLREDAERLAQTAQQAGVEVELAIYPRMWHVWQLNRELPQARDSLDKVARFFRKDLEAERATRVTS
ncbi:alpha/beta hydrolase [Thermomicrobium sp. 4228-Ro]|uniref:alpha/beta hydrolase n=1 Tax=Thermomicrobium sp. 4228-Ro TaxID=2993937 RepID=UPI0022488583|nr:alpha/beta hydrolase [Thermomicrobium sp. 4228-Ro]MCX2727920.1 alpha/beta hydrolase [Thermomicrobium sp. 4228-Ro]